jgi:hypothetical protein
MLDQTQAIRLSCVEGHVESKTPISQGQEVCGA